MEISSESNETGHEDQNAVSTEKNKYLHRSGSADKISDSKTEDGGIMDGNVDSPKLTVTRLKSVCPICGSDQPVHSCHAMASESSKCAKISEIGCAKFTNLLEHVESEEKAPKFVVIYLGTALLDRRFPPKDMMTWVMAEVKHSVDTFKEVCLEVLPHSLIATSCQGSTDLEHVFEHKLHHLSKFAKTHQDPRCFAYLRRQSLSTDFECHVFLAHDENLVPELFHCIRGATQHDHEEIERKEPEPAKACYEVMYVGRARMRGKKITSSHIDDLVTQLEVKYHQNKLKLPDDLDRQRHKSDSSIRSLPTGLSDENVQVKENELLKQKLSFRGTEIHMDSPTGSSDEIHDQNDPGDHGDNHSNHSFEQLSEEHSSSENLADSALSSSSSADQFKDMFTALHDHPEHSEDPDHLHGNEGHSKGQSHANVLKSANRIMLFRVGQLEISLISLDKKQVIIERQFKDISSVSQGNMKSDVFGFISRDQGNHLICHLLRCCSDSVVDDIMTALRASFQSAYEHSKLQTQQICVNCPLHQYHKLCQDINGLCPEAAHAVLTRRVQQLPERDMLELYQSLQNDNPQCHEETVEALMIALRRMCDVKQREHCHISDTGRSSQKSDFILVDLKGKSTKSALDNIRNKAKKTLTHSFESILIKVENTTHDVKEKLRHRSSTTESEGSTTHDIREALRYRSGTTDSEDSGTGRPQDLQVYLDQDTTPEASPGSSPALHTKDHDQFDFVTPPPSPVRPRSSTVGAAPDAGTVERLTTQAEKRRAAMKEQLKRRTNESPMKHMFIMANSSSPKRHSPQTTDDTSPVVTPFTPYQRGSWRQAIFNRVVTPARHPTTPTLPENLEERIPGIDGGRKSAEELRALWRKAILETLLLIRMERENLDLRARQDEAHLKRQKLDYQELTPCLKDITRVWDEMMLTPNRDTVHFDEQKLVHCVRQGVPRAKRGDIWWFLIEQHRLSYPNFEDQAPRVDYHELLKQLTTQQHAILIDLGRTFPGHPYFTMQLGNGQLALFNLLKAYSLMDVDVGYCQGLSFVAGFLLMHMEESVAFDAWKHVMYNLGLREQYRPNMIALQIELYQLTRLIHDNYRDVYDHFEEHEIAPTLYAAPWFLTVFASQFPLGFVARVFDLLFIQGMSVIFKVALVLLGNHKELILQCATFETIINFIKTTLPEMGMIQMERIINQVFNMDISKQLQAYEVEYHVLKEEMMYSPIKGDGDRIAKLEHANHSLQQQNMELIEKLQHVHSHQRSLDSMIQNYQTQENKMKSHIRTLEIERHALLNAVEKLKHLVPESDQFTLDLSLPVLAPSMPVSPIQGVTPQENISTTNVDSNVNNVNSSMSCTTVNITKSARLHPERNS